MQKKTIVVGIVVIAAATYAYETFIPHGVGGMPPGGAPPVSVAQVLERNVQLWNEFSGRLVAVDQAELRPQVSGTIDSVHFKDGAMVKKGDLLFTIDPRPYRAAYEAAQARATLTSSELERARKLLADKAIPQRDFDQRRSDAETAKAALTKAQLDLNYTTVRAPIDGRVSRAEITVGNLVDAGPGAPLLTTVVSYTPIYADFEVDENTFIQYATAGITGNESLEKIPVRMGLGGEAGTPHEGHVQSFDNRMSNASGTIRVRATFDNKDGMLVPGLFARVQLGIPNDSKAILITDRAVGTDQSKKFVFVVGEDSKATYREITLGATVDGLRVVRDGLKPNEKIIVNGLQRARPGAPVTPEVVPMDDKDALAPAAGAPAKQDK